jgi:rRNA maturation RNase YbeY
MHISFQTDPSLSHSLSRSSGLNHLPRQKLARWIKDVASAYGKKTGEIGYLFCSDEKILEFNRTYLQHNYFTDVITFDYTEGERIAGDIVISIHTVLKNAGEENEPFVKELYRVIIHGVLHLCGLNDKTEREQAEMRQAEDKALKTFFPQSLNRLFQPPEETADIAVGKGIEPQ